MYIVPLIYRYGPLLAQLKEMQKILHNPPAWSETEVLITNGSQDGLCKAFEMIMNLNDHVIVQEPVYAGTLAIVRHQEQIMSKKITFTNFVWYILAQSL